MGIDVPEEQSTYQSFASANRAWRRRAVATIGQRGEDSSTNERICANHRAARFLLFEQVHGHHHAGLLQMQVAPLRGERVQQVVECRVMLTDMADWPASNQVYASYFPGPKLTRSAWGVTALGSALAWRCLAPL
jgi:hypothetical protein